MRADLFSAERPLKFSATQARRSFSRLFFKPFGNA